MASKPVKKTTAATKAAPAKSAPFGGKMAPPFQKGSKRGK